MTRIDRIAVAVMYMAAGVVLWFAVEFLRFVFAC